MPNLKFFFNMKTFIAASVFSMQTLVLASNTINYARLKTEVDPKVQQRVEKIANKFNSYEPKKKIRILSRKISQANKIISKIEGLSEEKYSGVYQRRSAQKNILIQDNSFNDKVMGAEDVELLSVGMATETPNINPNLLIPPTSKLSTRAGALELLAETKMELSKSLEQAKKELTQQKTAADELSSKSNFDADKWIKGILYLAIFFGLLYFLGVGIGIAAWILPVAGVITLVILGIILANWNPF